MKIIVKNQFMFFKEHEILSFNSVAKQTMICFLNGNHIKIDESIENIEQQLKGSGFIRIHDKHIINVNHISKISNGNADFVELCNAEVLPIETGQKEIIIELLADHINNH